MESILDHFSLHGKKALVVCPENPYGREIIEGLISGFAEVWLAGDPASMPDLPVAGKIPYIHGDAASAAELEQIIRQQIGTLDILVENGLHTQVAGWEQDFPTIYSQLEKTHLGMMLTVQSLGHIFADQGHGSVILVTDYGALVGYDPQNYTSDVAAEDFSLVKASSRVPLSTMPGRPPITLRSTAAAATQWHSPLLPVRKARLLKPNSFATAK